VRLGSSGQPENEEREVLSKMRHVRMDRRFGASEKLRMEVLDTESVVEWIPGRAELRREEAGWRRSAVRGPRVADIKRARLGLSFFRTAGRMTEPSEIVINE
jgi:hypothetical protein